MDREMKVLHESSAFPRVSEKTGKESSSFLKRKKRYIVSKEAGTV